LIDQDYTYNMQLKDNKSNSTYLNQSYFNEDHIKRIDKGAYKLENNYSKNYITTDINGLNTLKINKLIRDFVRNDDELKEFDSKEQYIEQTKKGIMSKIWG